MKYSIFTRKHIHVPENEHLKRTLNAKHLISIGIGAMIGAGLFVLTGQVAAFNSGPAVVLSFIIAAILCCFTALCYAELTAMIPISGSAFSYIYVALGEFPAWFVGWTLTMGYLGAASTVAVGWSGYFMSLLEDFGFSLPSSISMAPISGGDGSSLEFSGAFLNLPALCLVLLVGALLVRGIKAATVVNNILVVVKLAVIVIFVACGVAFINSYNLVPFIPENSGVFGNFGWSGVFRGASILFFAFLGFDVLATLSQETHNPQKNVPVGMLGSMLICTIAYVAVSFVMVGIVPYTQLGGSNPIAIAMNALGPNFWWLRIVIKIAILAGLFSVVLAMILSQSRIFYIMAQDGLLPPQFGRLSKKTHSPLFGTVVLTLFCTVCSAFFPVGILGQLVSMTLLLAFGVVSVAVLILRYTHPQIARPFKVKFLPVISIVGALTCFIQMAFLPAITWIQLLIWTVLGFMIYFGYGMRHSVLRNKP